MTTILVCDTCRYSKAEKLFNERTGGEILADLLETAAGAGIRIKRHSCLMGCDNHCNIAIRDNGKLTYVLGRFNPTQDSADAIAEFAAGFTASDTGRVPFREWPQGVKGHFVSRVPPIEHDDE
ncbi:MAG: DUF1636 domain-containing protein [Rhodobacteraceae bacterium]|nr:DUF1636 domain-containing protein [Paracoccaceae bacterium]